MEAVEGSIIAWSYAAVLDLGLDASIVFHEGYRVDHEALRSNFEVGAYIGLSRLQDAGLTVVGPKAAELGLQPFPHMIKWLRE